MVPTPTDPLPLPPGVVDLLAGGPAVTFAEFVESALYDPVVGFYATGGVAGRRGDFLTSPEVGPLFGALIARYLDVEWERLGRPDPFVVVEAGAGPGTLARSVRVAEPACGPALVYVLVEVSAAQRVLHAEHLPGWVGARSGEGLATLVSSRLGGGGPVFASALGLPERPFGGVVLANELLDNLPFDVVRRVGDRAEQLLVTVDDGVLVTEPGPAPEELAAALADLGVPDRSWVPWQERAREWVLDALSHLREGRLLVLDYGGRSPELASRPGLGWMRTFRGHETGDHPLEGPGTQDITADVDVDQIQVGQPAARVLRQAAFLAELGIDDLVEEGRRTWQARAHAPDLVALRARSRIREAEALTEGAGLGDFWALEWHAGPAGELAPGPL